MIVMDLFPTESIEASAGVEIRETFDPITPPLKKVILHETTRQELLFM